MKSFSVYDTLDILVHSKVVTPLMAQTINTMSNNPNRVLKLDVSIALEELDKILLEQMHKLGEEKYKTPFRSSMEYRTKELMISDVLLDVYYLGKVIYFQSPEGQERYQQLQHRKSLIEGGWEKYKAAFKDQLKKLMEPVLTPEKFDEVVELDEDNLSRFSIIGDATSWNSIQLSAYLPDGVWNLSISTPHSFDHREVANEQYFKNSSFLYSVAASLTALGPDYISKVAAHLKAGALKARQHYRLMYYIEKEIK